jgi:hypothetical protein
MPCGSASQAAGLVSESEIERIPYGRRFLAATRLKLADKSCCEESSISGGIFNFEEEVMAAKISDTELLKVINRYMDADKICKETDLKLKTLQARVGRLTYKNLLENSSQIKGLYKPKPKIVKMSQNAIIIPKARIEDADFKIGDIFKVTCEEDRIILSRL